MKFDNEMQNHKGEWGITENYSDQSESRVPVEQTIEFQALCCGALFATYATSAKNSKYRNAQISNGSPK
jgi:hypothetical protein